jgi:signal peptidase I
MRRTAAVGGALALGALVAAALAARRARLEPVLVRGGSMRPTLEPGQRIAVAPLVRPPARGDLVVVARGRDLEVVKRVVGLPGERVRLRGGRLEVDGAAVPEPYLAGGRRGPGNPEGVPRSINSGAGELDLRLGPAEYLVLGDHRAASTDGRDFGPVGADALLGRVAFAYWPPRPLRWRRRLWGAVGGASSPHMDRGPRTDSLPDEHNTPR